MRLVLTSFAVTALAALVTAVPTASAQDITCADLEWSTEILAAHPRAPEACDAVVVRDGVRYARFNGTLERRYFNGVVKLRFQLPDGSHITDTFRPDESFTAEMGGEPKTFDNIPVGRVPFRVYVPEGQWAIASIPVEEEIVVVVVESVPEPAEPAPELPATGGPLPLFGLLGGLLVGLGATMTAVRRR